MADILVLKPKVECVAVDPERKPHLTGEAFCGACGYEWIAVMEEGIASFDCPSCDRHWGAYKHIVVPKTSVWSCNCGERLFWLTPDGAFCRKCGVISSDWAR